MSQKSIFFCFFLSKWAAFGQNKLKSGQDITQKSNVGINVVVCWD